MPVMLLPALFLPLFEPQGAFLFPQGAGAGFPLLPGLLPLKGERPLCPGSDGGFALQLPADFPL